MSDMEDLKRRVHKLLYSQHTKLVESDPLVTDVLGIEDPEGTILDPEHEFWDEYEDDVTKADCEQLISFAIHSLEDDGKFSMLNSSNVNEAFFMKVEDPNPEWNGMKNAEQVCPSCAGGPWTNIEMDFGIVNRTPSILVSFECEDCGEEFEYHTNLNHR